MIKDYLNSSSKAIVVVLLVIVTLIVATLFERTATPAVAQMLFYHSWWLWLLLLVGTIMSIYQVMRPGRKLHTIAIHFALLIIASGAITSHYTAEEGFVVVRENTKSSAIINEKREQVATLPFQVMLHKFEVARYGGSGSPADYISDITIVDGEKESRHQISMNQVVDYGGYRFYQSSYDADEKGTILMVNKDTLGTTITYVGYILLFFGLVLSFFAKRSRFRVLLRRLTLAIMFLFPTLAQAQVSTEALDAVSLIPVQAVNGHIEPLSTFSQQVFQKVYGDRHYGSIRSEQIVMQMLAGDKSWQHEPIIEVDNKQVKEEFKISGDHASFAHFFDHQRGYKLRDVVNEVHAKPNHELNKYDKEIIALDEKISIIYQLYAQQLPNLLPIPNSKELWLPMAKSTEAQAAMLAQLDQILSALANDRAHEIPGLTAQFVEMQHAATIESNRVSKERLQAEVLYNRVNIPFVTAILLLTLGLIGVFTFLAQTKKDSSWVAIYGKMVNYGVLLGAILLTVNILLRWYIAGRAPVSNSYETILFISYMMCCGAWLTRKVSLLITSSIAFVSGCFLMMSYVALSNPQITPLVPVLNSHWLLYHVASIAVSYGMFALSTVMGLVYMLLQAFTDSNEKIQQVQKRITALNELSQLVGVVFLTIGIFLGAVWANVSWGRYWAWDPKETWALITLLVYVINTHLYLAKNLYSAFTLNVLSIYSIATVIMTFFGVNLFFGGMHSYGGVYEFPVVTVGVVTLVVTLLVILAYIKLKKRKNG